MKKQLEGDGTIHLRKHQDLVSNVHIFTGYKYTDHSVLQVGELCPDEILELAVDEKQPSTEDLGTKGSSAQGLKAGEIPDEEHIAKVLRAE